MATVTYPEGSYREGQLGHKPFEIDDNDAQLIAYYRGEGATVIVAGEDEVEQGDPLDLSVEHVHPGYSEPMVGVEHPADGTASPEISND